VEVENDDRTQWSKDKFGKATSISSDQYFQRNEYSETPTDQKEKLQKYRNATAISSDQFFDRPAEQEDDESVVNSLAESGRKIGSHVSNLFSGIRSQWVNR